MAVKPKRIQKFLCGHLGCTKMFTRHADKLRHQRNKHFNGKKQCSQCLKELRKDKLRNHFKRCPGSRGSRVYVRDAEEGDNLGTTDWAYNKYLASMMPFHTDYASQLFSDPALTARHQHLFGDSCFTSTLAYRPLPTVPMVPSQPEVSTKSLKLEVAVGDRASLPLPDQDDCTCESGHGTPISFTELLDEVQWNDNLDNTSDGIGH